VGRDAAGLALLLKGWSEDVVALTEGGPISARVRARLMSHRIQVVHPRVARLRGRGGRLTSIVLANGESLPCDALFFKTGQVQGSPLPASLGCKVGPDGGICVDDRERTCVPGLLVIGDALKQVQFVVTAAAAGADAAVAVCQVLQAEEGRVLGPSRNPR
jgi:thioredoxin reductase